MADIAVLRTGPRTFEVKLGEAGTTHNVTVPESLIQELNLP